MPGVPSCAASLSLGAPVIVLSSDGLGVSALLRDMAQNMSHYGLRTKRGALLRAAAEIDRLISELTARLVPPDVMRAAERMAQPLHESRLSGATAQEDARCAWLVLSFLRAHAEPK